MNDWDHTGKDKAIRSIFPLNSFIHACSRYQSKPYLQSTMAGDVGGRKIEKAILFLRSPKAYRIKDSTDNCTQTTLLQGNKCWIKELTFATEHHRELLARGDLN